MKEGSKPTPQNPIRTAIGLPPTAGLPTVHFTPRARGSEAARLGESLKEPFSTEGSCYKLVGPVQKISPEEDEPINAARAGKVIAQRQKFFKDRAAKKKKRLQMLMKICLGLHVFFLWCLLAGFCILTLRLISIEGKDSCTLDSIEGRDIIVEGDLKTNRLIVEGTQPSFEIRGSVSSTLQIISTSGDDASIALQSGSSTSRIVQKGGQDQVSIEIEGSEVAHISSSGLSGVKTLNVTDVAASSLTVGQQSITARSTAMSFKEILPLALSSGLQVSIDSNRFVISQNGHDSVVVDHQNITLSPQTGGYSIIRNAMISAENLEVGDLTITDGVIRSSTGLIIDPGPSQVLRLGSNGERILLASDTKVDDGYTLYTSHISSPTSPLTLSGDDGMIVLAVHNITIQSDDNVAAIYGSSGVPESGSNGTSLLVEASSILFKAGGQGSGGLGGYLSGATGEDGISGGMLFESGDGGNGVFVFQSMNSSTADLCISGVEGNKSILSFASQNREETFSLVSDDSSSSSVFSVHSAGKEIVRIEEANSVFQVVGSGGLVVNTTNPYQFVMESNKGESVMKLLGAQGARIEFESFQGAQPFVISVDDADGDALRFGIENSLSALLLDMNGSTTIMNGSLRVESDNGLSSSVLTDHSLRLSSSTEEIVPHILLESVLTNSSFMVSFDRNVTMMSFLSSNTSFATIIIDSNGQISMNSTSVTIESPVFEVSKVLQVGNIMINGTTETITGDLLTLDMRNSILSSSSTLSLCAKEDIVIQSESGRMVLQGPYGVSLSGKSAGGTEFPLSLNFSSAEISSTGGDITLIASNSVKVEGNNGGVLQIDGGGQKPLILNGTSGVIEGFLMAMDFSKSVLTSRNNMTLQATNDGGLTISGSSGVTITSDSGRLWLSGGAQNVTGDSMRIDFEESIIHSSSPSGIVLKSNAHVEIANSNPILVLTTGDTQTPALTLRGGSDAKIFGAGLETNFAQGSMTATSGNLTLQSPSGYILLNSKEGVIVNGTHPRLLPSSGSFSIDFFPSSDNPNAFGVFRSSGDLLFNVDGSVNVLGSGTIVLGNSTDPESLTIRGTYAEKWIKGATMLIDLVGRTVKATTGNLTLASSDDYVVINGALGVLVDGPRKLVTGNQMDIDFDARAIRTNSESLVIQASSRLDLQAGTGGIRFLPLDTADDVQIVLGSSLASATLTRPVSLPGHPAYPFNIIGQDACHGCGSGGDVMIRAGNGSLSGFGGSLMLSAGDGQSDASGGSVFISAGVGTKSGNVTIMSDVFSISRDRSSSPLLQVRTQMGNAYITVGNVDASCSPFDDDYTKSVLVRGSEIVVMGGESISIATEVPPGRISGGTKIEIGDGTGGTCTEKIILRAQEILLRDEDMSTALHVTRNFATLKRNSSISLETTAGAGGVISIGTKEAGFTEIVSVSATDIVLRAAQAVYISTGEDETAFSSIHIGSLTSNSTHEIHIRSDDMSLWDGDGIRRIHMSDTSFDLSGSREVHLSTSNTSGSSILIGLGAGAPSSSGATDNIVLRAETLSLGTSGGDHLVVNGSGIYLIPSSGNVDVSGDVDVAGKIQEDGFDLVPSGSVMFFRMTSCPPGWSHVGESVGRVVMGMADVSASYATYDSMTNDMKTQGTPRTQGASNDVTLTTTASTTPSGGAHAHSATTSGPSGGTTVDTSSLTTNVASSSHTHSVTISSSGAHTHSIPALTISTSHYDLVPVIYLLVCLKD